MRFRVLDMTFCWREINPGEMRFFPPGGAVYSSRKGWLRPVISHRLRAFYGIMSANGFTLGLSLYGERRHFYEAEHREYGRERFS